MVAKRRCVNLALLAQHFAAARVHVDEDHPAIVNELEPIGDRGRIVGLWEYDPDARAIAWTAWVPASPALRAAVEATEAWVRDDLGDARAFSLDSPASRRPRIEALRRAGSA